jgi:hypothetical protein
MNINKNYGLLLPPKIHPALIAVWAALVGASHIIPAIPMLGTGRSFSLATALYPLSGIFFGPIQGALCSIAGGFIGSLIAPHTAWLGLFTFVIGTASAFTSGCIAWSSWPPIALNIRGSLVINGGIIIYLLGTALWFSQEIGRSVPLFPAVFYGAGFAALIIGIVIAGKILSGKNSAFKFFALWLCAFGGMIGGATIGNFFTLVLFQLPRETWIYLTVAAPIERAVFSLGTAMIGVPLLTALPKAGIFLGPQRVGAED